MLLHSLSIIPRRALLMHVFCMSWLPLLKHWMVVRARAVRLQLCLSLYQGAQNISVKTSWPTTMGQGVLVPSAVLGNHMTCTSLKLRSGRPLLPIMHHPSISVFPNCCTVGSVGVILLDTCFTSSNTLNCYFGIMHKQHSVYSLIIKPLRGNSVVHWENLQHSWGLVRYVNKFHLTQLSHMLHCWPWVPIIIPKRILQCFLNRVT